MIITRTKLRQMILSEIQKSIVQNIDSGDRDSGYDDRYDSSQKKKADSKDDIPGGDSGGQTVKSGNFSVTIPQGVSVVHPVPIYNGKSYKAGSKPTPSRKDVSWGKGRPHRGWDFRTGANIPILAYSDGTVSYAGYAGSAGNLVKISHNISATDGGRSGKLVTMYMHLNKLMVKSGQTVKAGDVIGLSGGTGKRKNGKPSVTGPHLHFSFRIGKGASSDNISFYNNLLSKARVIKVNS